jgi:hypothetical protein
MPGTDGLTTIGFGVSLGSALSSLMETRLETPKDG